MKHSLLVFLLPPLCLLAASCYKGSQRMDKIEVLLQEQPDSALLLLGQIDPARLSSRKEKAYYALLQSAALDKNYVDITSDSLISLAVDYYSKRNDIRHKMMAFYYQGIILQNAQNYSSSIIAFEQAENNALVLEDSFYLGLILRNKAHTFNQTNNPLAAIRYQKEAIEYFKKANKDIYAAYATVSLAIEYFNNQAYNDALQCLDEVNGIERLQDQCDILKADILVKTGKNYEQALLLYNNVPPDKYDFQDCALFALALEHCGNSKDADLWISEAYKRCPNEAGKGNIEFYLGRIEALRGNHNSAFLLTSHACSVQDSVTRTILQQSVSEAQRDYFKTESLLQRERYQRMQDRLVFTGSMGIILLLFMVTVLVSKRKENERKQKEQMLSLRYHKQLLGQARRNNAELLGSLFREKLNHLDAVSEAYLNAEDEDGKYQAFKQFKAELATIRKDDNLFDSLENDLNKYCNGIMEKLASQVPTIKGEHKRIIMLFFAGLHYGTIQLIMNKTSKESLKMTRSRYRKQIKEAHATDADFFLDMLEMKKTGPVNTDML